MQAGNANPILSRVYTLFSPESPQIEIKVNREKMASLGVDFGSAMQSFSVNFGGAYVNDTFQEGKVRRVYVQADDVNRATPEQLSSVYVKSMKGEQIPLSEFFTVKPTTGPSVIPHFNLYRSIKIDGTKILGTDRRTLEAMRRRFGMTFQFGALFDSLPIWENVTFRLRHQQKMNRTDARDLAVDTITQLGLSPQVIDQYPAELSGGMQKRVALARAIADKPEILLFDEPTSGLDPITGGVIDRLIIDAVKRLGATAMTISHDMASVRRIADKVAMIHNGVIIWCVAVAEMDETGVPEVDQFVHGRAAGPLTIAAKEEARRG